MTTSHDPSPTNGTNGTSNPSSAKPPLFETNGSKPIHYGVLLFPGFQALDVFGPLDVFNSLSMLYREFPTKLTVLAKTTDAVETSHQRAGNMMFSHLETDFSQSMVVDRSFEEQLRLQESVAEGEASADAIDVLIVPGGVGTRNDMSAEIDFVKRMYPSLKALLCVCTGATILARAGVLDGRRATTNKRAYAWATSTGPKVNWVAEARWVVDGNIITGSGISAGIDATYAFVGLNYGEKIAQELADSAEYVRWTDADHDPFAKRWNKKKPAPKGEATNLDHLLQILRSELGPNWGFYKEFLVGVTAAIARGESTSAWVEQIEALVQEPARRFAHQGVLFLLSELRSEAPSANNMGPPPLPHRISLPVPQPPAINMEQDDVAERVKMLPFDFNASAPSTPASATFSQSPVPNVALFGEKRSHHKKQPPRPADDGYGVFFRDPAFQRDVQEFFGVTSHGEDTRNTDRRITGYFDNTDVAPVYKAKDDDLAIWKKRIEAGNGMKGDDAQSNAEKDKSAEHVLRENIHQDVLQYGLFEDLSEDASKASGLWGVSG